MNGVDQIKIACIQGLLKQVQAKIKELSDVNPEQTDTKAIASENLYQWEWNELGDLKQCYEEVETN